MHVVDMTGGFEDRDPVEDYHIINRELEQYGAELSERPQIVVANKCDAPGTADKIADLKRAAARRWTYVLCRVCRDGRRPQHADACRGRAGG